MTPVVTRDYEQQLWEELNALLVDVVPAGATEARAEDAILLACMGHDLEIHNLYDQVKRLARERAGYLRERLEEDNPVARVRRRLYGQWA